MRRDESGAVTSTGPASAAVAVAATIWRRTGVPSAASKRAGRQPELVAPAGDEAALRAALSAGADAVYLGLDRWSARAFAGNFTGPEVVAAIDRAHLYGARAHLALNTLLKEEELGPALEALQAPYEAGLDALIVADLGFAALVRERYPELELHASTQLNTHAASQIDLLAGWGLQRAIVARELSLDEITALAGRGLALEVFVHGALCYGYSGLCLLSSMVGGRSGNRGRCSQACRMRYRLLRGDEGTALERVLSTADLAAIGALPALLGAGVQAFKIEGRMKDARYVAVVTAVYREALDAAWPIRRATRCGPTGGGVSSRASRAASRRLTSTVCTAVCAAAAAAAIAVCRSAASSRWTTARAS